MGNFSKVAAMLAMVPTLAGASLPPVPDGQTDAHPRWRLGRGATSHGITNILSGPAMAFYVQDAKEFTKMYNSKAYQDYINQHPELKINNPYADPTVAKYIADFEKAMKANDAIGKQDAPNWDKRCEVVADASAKHFAHFINIQLVNAGKSPFDFGSSGKLMRGTHQGNWMDGTFGKFLNSPDGKSITFNTPNGVKTLSDLYIGWCRAQTAQVQSETETPNFPTKVAPPSIQMIPPVQSSSIYGAGTTPRESLNDPKPICLQMVPLIEGKTYAGVKIKDKWNPALGVLIPIGGGGGGFHCPCPTGCANVGGVF